MRIKIKRLDKTLPLPEYKTSGAVAFDLTARTDAAIEPKTLSLVPLNVIIKIPEGHTMILASRSSLPIKKGLLIPNGIGVFDQDYCGPEDEWRLEVFNFTDKKVKIEKGERIAQALIVPIVRAEWDEVDEMTEPTRGGFGSTG